MPIAKTWIIWLLIGLAFFIFIYAIKAILLPFVVGILVAYLLDPLADRLERHKCSRTVATAIITLVFFALVIAGLVVLVPVLYHQVMNLIQVLPGYIDQLKTMIGPYVSDVLVHINEEDIAAVKDGVGSVSGSLLAVMARLSRGVLDSGLAVFNLISLIVITPVVTFYLLRDWDNIVTRIDDLLPRPSRDVIHEQLVRIDDTLAGFMRGTLNVMLILGTFYAVTLSLMELPFAIVIGLLGGLLIIIPYLGTVISGALAVGVAYLHFNTIQEVLVVFVIFVIGQVLEGYALTPKLVGDRVGLHPVWLIFGMLVGATLFGFVGILLAVPVTAVIGVLVKFAAEQYRDSSLYQGERRPSKKGASS